MKKKFDVEGMTCAACQAHVEKAVKNVDGVNSVSVNLLTKSMSVDYDQDLTNDENIESAVSKIGYKAMSRDLKKDGQEAVIDEEKNLKFRLKISFIFLIALMYVSMGHMINLPLPEFISQKSGLNNAFLQFLLAIPVIFVNRKFYISGFTALKNRTPNMDSLVFLGSSAALIYGIFAIFRMNYAVLNSQYEIYHIYRHNLYFESSAMILGLITIGKYLEERSKKKTTSAIEKLLDLSPKFANVIKDNREVKTAVEDIRIDDKIIIRPGESIPVDGEIIEGSSSIDQSALTGEPIPKSVKEGDEVMSGSINTSGSFVFVARKKGEDSTLQKIIELVESANQSKAPISMMADKVSSVFVPIVIVISAISLIAWLIAGKGAEFALNMAISVLVISCPCALGLATPVAIMVATGRAAREGLLFKDAKTLENLHKSDVILMDKTGTLTMGKPEVSDIITDLQTREFLNIIAGLEKNSEHPLAGAIKNYAQKNGVKGYVFKDFNSKSGRGISAKLEDKMYFGGNISYMKEIGINLDGYDKLAEELAKDGKTCMYFSTKDRVIGIIAVMDMPKKSAKFAVSKLMDMGLEVCMITGDDYLNSRKIADMLDIENIHCSLLPKDKFEIIDSYKNEGKRTIMVGDGINDAPSLARADIGMAIGEGTDIAIESSDVVLMKTELLDIVKAIKLSEITVKNIRGNLFWAFFYNVLGIPLAAGVFYPHFGLKLNPMFGAFAMSLSSLFVVTNALRIRNKNLGINDLSDKELALEDIKGKDIERTNNMEKERVVKIKGMSCEHCQKAVKEALETIDGVRAAMVNHEDGIAKLTINEDIDNNKIEAVVKEAGYEVTSIE